MQHLACDSPPLPTAAAFEPSADPAGAGVGNGWLLALGSATLWQLDPALMELGAFACAVACASSQALARESVLQMRAHAASQRRRVSPLSARAMSRVVRNAERASG